MMLIRVSKLTVNVCGSRRGRPDLKGSTLQSGEYRGALVAPWPSISVKLYIYIACISAAAFNPPICLNSSLTKVMYSHQCLQFQFRWLDA